jgi:hypothetical protein
VISQVLTAEAFFEPPDYLGVFLYKNAESLYFKGIQQSIKISRFIYASLF